MSYGLNTRTISSPLGTAGVSSPTAPATRLVPLSVFFLNREGEGTDGTDDKAMYGLQTPGEKAREGLKKAAKKEPGGEPGGEEDEPEKGDKKVRRKKKLALKKKEPPRKPREPEQGGPEPQGGAVESVAEAKDRAHMSEPQKCKYCSDPATKAYIWADGRAYIPVCESHREAAKTRIEKSNRDKVTAVRDIPQRQTTAAAEQAPIVAPVLTPVKDGTTRDSSGAMGTGNVAQCHVSVGPPLRRMSPVGDEEGGRKRKRKRRKLQGEDRDRWIERLMKITKK